jgi:hypothetical protein
MFYFTFLISCGGLQSLDADPVKEDASINAEEAPPVEPPVEPQVEIPQVETPPVVPPKQAELLPLAGRWVAVEAKGERQVVHAYCGEKYNSITIGERITVESDIEKMEQLILTSRQDEAGGYSIGLQDEETTLEVNLDEQYITVTGWGMSDKSFVKESEIPTLERIAIFDGGCTEQATQPAELLGALTGEWIPRTEYKCAPPTFKIFEGSFVKGSERLEMIDIRGANPMWVTVKDSEGVLSGLTVSPSTKGIALMDGTLDEWTEKSFKKRSCDRPAGVPNGPRKIVPQGMKEKRPMRR